MPRRQSSDALTSNTGSLSINVSGMNSVGIEILTTATLTSFSISEDGVVTGSGFTTPSGNIIGASGDLTAIVKSNTGWIILDTTNTSNVTINTSSSATLRANVKPFPLDSDKYKVNNTVALTSVYQTVFERDVSSAKTLTLALSAPTNALDAFTIDARFHPDGEYHTLYSVAADYTTTKGLLTAASGDLTSLVGSGSLTLNLDGIEKLRISSASSSTTVLVIGGDLK